MSPAPALLHLKQRRTTIQTCLRSALASYIPAMHLISHPAPASIRHAPPMCEGTRTLVQASACLVRGWVPRGVGCSKHVAIPPLRLAVAQAAPPHDVVAVVTRQARYAMRHRVQICAAVKNLSPYAAQKLPIYQHSRCVRAASRQEGIRCKDASAFAACVAGALPVRAAPPKMA